MSGAVDGADILRRRMDAITRRQLPFALSRAINLTAREIRDRTGRRITSVFDAKRFTQNAPFVSYGNKRRPDAIVGIKDRQARYLRVHETGGGRRHKGFERALMFRGVIGPDEYVVPAEGRKFTRSTYTRILSQVGALREGSASDSTRSRRSRRRRGTFFVTQRPDRPGAGSGLPRGIWMRTGIFIEPVFWITRKRPKYERRFGFRSLAMTVFEREFRPTLRFQLRRAISTAR